MEGLRKKTFVVSTILVSALLLLLCVIPGFFADGESGGAAEQPAPTGEPGSICYVLESGEPIPGLLASLSEAYPDIRFETSDPGSLEQHKADIEKHDALSALLVDSKGGGLPALTFYTKDFMTGPPTDGIAQTVKSAYITARFAQEGVPESLAALTSAKLTVTTETVGEMNLTGYVLGIVVTLIMFFAIYMYGYWVAMSVASEKTSRVMETLVVSCKPSRILIGKCLGMGALGLLQMAIFLLVGGVALQVFLPGAISLGGMPLSFDALNLPNALLLIAYFILGYALYALLNSVCGATVSRAEDIQAALTPVMMITLLAFYMAYFGAILPGGGTLRTAATYIPFTSPFVMPFRLLNETVPMGEILSSMGILLVSILAIAALSIRLYTVSVLHYGQRLKLRQLFHTKM